MLWIDSRISPTTGVDIGWMPQSHGSASPCYQLDDLRQLVQTPCSNHSKRDGSYICTCLRMDRKGSSSAKGEWLACCSTGGSQYLTERPRCWTGGQAEWNGHMFLGRTRRWREPTWMSQEVSKWLVNGL